MKKVLVLSSSLRKGSNSETLAQEFAKGAAEAGNKVEFESLRGKKIGLQWLPRLPEKGQVRHQGRRTRHHQEDGIGRCHRVRNADLLLRDERPAQDDARPR